MIIDIYPKISIYVQVSMDIYANVWISINQSTGPSHWHSSTAVLPPSWSVSTALPTIATRSCVNAFISNRDIGPVPPGAGSCAPESSRMLLRFCDAFCTGPAATRPPSAESRPQRRRGRSRGDTGGVVAPASRSTPSTSAEPWINDIDRKWRASATFRRERCLCRHSDLQKNENSNQSKARHFIWSDSEERASPVIRTIIERSKSE